MSEVEFKFDVLMSDHDEDQNWVFASNADEKDVPVPTPRATRSKAHLVKSKFAEVKDYLDECMNMCSQVVAMSDSIDEIRKSLQTVLDVFGQLKSILRDMRGVVVDEELSSYASNVNEINDSIKQISADVTNHIHQIRDYELHTGSNAGSQKSASSKKSKNSRLSAISNVSLNMHKLRRAEEEAAVLKASLTFIEDEEELSKKQKTLQLKKKIAIQEAIVKECYKIEHIDNPFGLTEDLAAAAPPTSTISESNVDLMNSQGIDSSNLSVTALPFLYNKPSKSQVSCLPIVDNGLNISKFPVVSSTSNNSNGSSCTTVMSSAAFVPVPSPAVCKPKGSVRETLVSINSLPVTHVSETHDQASSKSEAVGLDALNAIVSSDAMTGGPAQHTVTHAHDNTNVCARKMPVVQGSISDFSDSLEPSPLALIQDMLRMQRLPSVKLWKFDGNPVDYPKWEASFEALVETHVKNISERMNLLRQYLGDGPLKVVDGYLLSNTEESYNRAKSELKCRYGGNTTIGNSFLSKLKAWKSVKGKKGLQDFSDFLLQVRANKDKVKDLNTLDYACCQIPVVKKLPIYVQNRWESIVFKFKEEVGDKDAYPPFDRFVSFVKYQSDIKNQAEFDTVDTENSEYKGNDQKSISFSAVVDPGKCLYCSEQHQVSECDGLSKLSFVERKQFFRKKFLCYGCGKRIGKGHNAHTCPKRSSCSICSRPHLTCFHLKDNTDSASSFCSEVCCIPDQENGGNSSLVVPVWIRTKSKPNLEILSYCVLDNQSNSSFITDKLLDQLNTAGHETKISLSTLSGSNIVSCKKVNDLEVLSYDKKQVISVNSAFTRNEIPLCRSQIPKVEVCSKWEHLKPICKNLVPYDPNLDVSILLGSDCPSATRPRDVKAGDDDDHPYGVRTLLGWGVVGPVCKDVSNNAVVCHRTVVNSSHEVSRFAYATKTKEIITPRSVAAMFELEFAEYHGKNNTFSVEDQKFIDALVHGTFQRPDGHLELPLPLKNESFSLPNNKVLAVKRLKQLKRKLLKNDKFHDDYLSFMKNVLDQWAELVPKVELDLDDGKVNYIPHLGVYHPHKPEKIRIVFDCSGEFKGVSLNDFLLSGPVLLNEMLGVLCRFRKGFYCVCADVESMFHQFYVSKKYRNLLRFLWFRDNDVLNGELIEYRLKVHLFGAKSSPGCANFGLKRAADDGEAEFGVDAANFIREDFYVDDGLTSRDSVHDIVSLVKNSKALCSKFGLRLCKFLSNSKEVMKSIPIEDRASDFKELNSKSDSLTATRALGVSWNVLNDSLEFCTKLKDSVITRRGILSTVNSVYDPLGFLAPLVLEGKLILQALCKTNTKWDDPVEECLQKRWANWQGEISNIGTLKIDRCFKPPGFGTVKHVEFHHFSDASTYAYGQSSYVRLVDEADNVHCSFVIGKARVAPLNKHVSVPRLELSAAVVSARMSKFLRDELKYGAVSEYFWVDSMVVLGYVQNEAKRFSPYVANRVQTIHDYSDPSSWHYVSSKMNPSDDASRGLSAKNLTSNCRWLRGPAFLWKKGKFIPDAENCCPSQRENDVILSEMRKASVFKSNLKVKDQFDYGILETDRLNSFSTWQRTLRAVANCIKYVRILRKQYHTMNSEILKSAENLIIRSIQRDAYAKEVECLRDSSNTVGGSLSSLNPFIDEFGIIRVGGRLRHLDDSFTIKHPIVLPRSSSVTLRIVRHFHELENHMGRYITLNSIRQHGYWVIRGPSVVSGVIRNCVNCKRLRGPLQFQKMADLPVDRLSVEPPFTYSGCDVFGTFYIKERRSTVKRYCVVFTCMSSRAIHIESLNSMTTDSFISALRRFLARRGVIKQLRCDCGTNFVGASNEFKRELKEMNQAKVKSFLLEKRCDYFEFCFSTPHASHMSGFVERQIKTIKSALEPSLQKFGHILCDESFRTLLCEVECIVNSRPLDVVNINDPDAPEPLTPNQILTLKSKIVLPPPGIFQKDDQYLRRRWRRVQYLADLFWHRWKRGYLVSLQARNKWHNIKRNFQINDIVLLCDEHLPRNRWKLGKIVATFPSSDNLIRKVKIMLGTRDLLKNGQRRGDPTYLCRPINKLVLLLPSAGPAIKAEKV